MMERFDLVIAGGGAAGLSLALAVKAAAGSQLSVAVCDPSEERQAQGDSRAYAIVAGACRFFDSFGAWPLMREAAQPILGMEITDSALEEPYRAPFLEFLQQDKGDGIRPHMLPNGAIVSALLKRARDLGVALLPVSISAFRVAGARIEAQAGERRFSARLLVAADGRGSKLREAAGIAYYGWKYPQTAIVGTVHHTLPHEGIAVQHFLPSGPFALLPLTGNRCSIVWSEKHEIARRMLGLDADELLEEVNRRAAGRFGTITAFDKPEAFPLSLGIARTFVSERLALLGDAAHGMHPIAGQGLNYGLRGAAALAEAIIDAARLGLDIGSEDVLKGYEQARRPDVMSMVVTTETLNRLFSNDNGALRIVRDFGLGVVNRLPGLKSRLMAEAAGQGALAPRAFRGLPV